MQICLKCSSGFEITDQDRVFYEKISPVFNGKKYQMPEPKLCPACRQQRRLAFRNERKLYKRQCNLCQKNIISMYHDQIKVPVYCTECWWSDKWDAIEYGRDFDFSKTFSDQFLELKTSVPMLAAETSPDIYEYNSIYVNYAGFNKNCYLIFDSDYNEDCLYSNVLKHDRNCVDSAYTQGSELCYECVDCDNCYNLAFSQDCSNCNDSKFIKDCIGCASCFLCTNLRNKKYHIQNKPYSKDEYEAELEKYKVHEYASIKNLLENLRSLVQKSPQKYIHGHNMESCSGDYIYNAKDCHYCFNVAETQDLRYSDSVFEAKDCMDVSSFGIMTELSYESDSIGHDCFGVSFCNLAVMNASNLLYCNCARQAQYNFGCSSLRRKDYSVLNKQYAKEDYTILAAKIIEHMQKTNEWGEFFNPKLSTFGYDETVAQEYFPLNKEDALGKGFKWDDYEAPFPAVEKTIPAEKLPEMIDKVPDQILDWAVTCEITQKPFRITKPELMFYRKSNIPLPHRHPDQRHRDRLALRNPRKLWHRVCDKEGCQAEFESSYSPERPEKIYCEECYKKEVY